MAVQRITGLATGLDYEKIINDLMKAERTPLDKLKQQKQIYQWQQEIFRDINSSLLALRTEAFNMKLSSSYKIFNTSSSDTTTVTATATSTASEGTYKVKVKQLATTAEKKSTAPVSPLLKSTADITNFNMSGKDFYITFNGVQKHILWSNSEGNYANITELVAGIQTKINDAFGTNQITISNDGNKIIFSPTDSTFKPNILLGSGTISDALPQLNFANGAQYHISLDTQLQNLVFANGSLTFDGNGKLNFSINGVNFSIDKTATLNTLFSTVNSDPNADVIMGYDAEKDIIYIRRKSSGAGKDIVFTDGAGSNFSTAVGLGATVLGQNAIIDFTDNNGVLTTNIEKPTNNFTISGLNLTLLKVDTLTDKTITVTKDIDAVYNKIKAFVDKYNETIDKIYTKLTEKRYYDYPPLTEDQKKEMKDSEIKLWEEKAKSGLVNGDLILEGILRDLRNSISNEVPGLNSSYNQIKEFGITTGSYQEHGKLYIDENKLKQIIGERPDDVMNFFSITPPDLKGNILNGVVDVNNKDFRVTINGITQVITLSGSYDLNTAEGKTNLINELNNKFIATFGYNQIVASLSTDNRIVLTSQKGYSFTLNSGTVNDALVTLGFADGSKYNADQKGVIAKVYDNLNLAINRIIEKAGSSSGLSGYFDNSIIGKAIYRLDLRISDMEKRLIEIENRYYKQFSAMEAAISRMNTQSLWLAQQFSQIK